MNREERVMDILRKMIATPSKTGSVEEVAFEQKIHQFLTAMENVTCGMIHISNDVFNRSLVYGFIQGKTKNTVIFMNHHDVVSTVPYGRFQSHALDPDALLQDLIDYEGDDKLLEELKSGEWLVGRGSCDMKGGAAAQLAVFEEYAKNPGNASLIYLTVPDEEMYSNGMRAALPVLEDLRRAYGLHYNVLIDSEPNPKIGGHLQVYTGSVGKMLPIVFVQGKPAHAGAYHQGINSVSVLARVISLTEGDMTLADQCGNETTPPPSWVYLRDRKKQYDVSLPYRAAACANFMTYKKTPDDVMYTLVEAVRHAADEELKGKDADLSMEVISAAELLKRASAFPGFDVFYSNLQNNSFVALQRNETTYVEETIRLIEEILNFTGMKKPMAIIAIAPPYYPAADSRVAADDGFNGLLDYIDSIIPVTYRHYFNGISDCSYCFPDPNIDNNMVEKNLIVWGKSYGMDFQAMSDMKIPFLLLGPWGKDLHERTERVHIESVSKTLPDILEKVVEYVGNLG